MAEFEIEHAEGMRWVKVTLKNDSIRAEKGALNHMLGQVTMDTSLPSLRNVLISFLSEESLLRPHFKGTGEVHLESSLGGFHILDVQPGETWIVENGAYWASDDEIDLSVYRESLLTAFWAGEGFFWYQTKVKGQGKVVLASQGPVEQVSLNNESFVADGKFVLARTNGISLKIRRPTRSLLGYFLSGERYARVYSGTGKLLVSTTPYWRFRMQQPGHQRDAALME